MEDTLRDTIDTTPYEDEEGLNPCFNGRYSQRADFNEENNVTRARS